MNLFELTNYYIQQEIDKLKKDNKLPEGFQIRQALIKRPIGGEEKVIEFNEKIEWVFEIEPIESLSEGQDAFIRDFKKLISAKFPEHKGVKVGYIFLFYTGFDYKIIFDCSPHHIKQDQIAEKGSKYLVAIANYYNLYFSERIIKEINETKRNILTDNGFFISPRILPYPLNTFLKDGDIINFTKEIENKFDNEIIKHIENKRFDNSIFKERELLIKESLFCYKNEKYISSISTLITQVEGIIREYLSNIKTEHKKISIDKGLSNILGDINDNQKSHILNFIINSFVNSINDRSGGFLSNFQNWTDYINKNITPRHVISHGKYDNDIYTKINNIKLFLILDFIVDIFNMIESGDSFTNHLIEK